MLVRMDEGVLIAVGCGERDEAASQAERAGRHAHRYGKGAAGRGQGRVTTDADLAGYTEGAGRYGSPGLRPKGMSRALEAAPSGSVSYLLTDSCRARLGTRPIASLRPFDRLKNW